MERVKDGEKGDASRGVRSFIAYENIWSDRADFTFAWRTIDHVF